MVIAVRIQVGFLFCLCFEIIAMLNLNRTHLFPAITLRSMCEDLCGEPTCCESNDAVVTMIIAKLCSHSNEYSTNPPSIGLGFCGRRTKQMIKPLYWRQHRTYLTCFECHVGVVHEMIAILNFNRTQLFPAITQRIMCEYLCREPTCYKSYDAVDTEIIADLCIHSNNYSKNQRCIGSGLCGQRTKGIAEHLYWRQSRTSTFLESYAV